MGKRYGLCVGLNYAGNTNNIPKLRGCINDLNQWVYYTDTSGFDSVDSLEEGQATCGAILFKLGAILDKAEPGDLVAYCHSGHGTIIPPGRVSLVPYDFNWNSPQSWLTYDALDQLLLAHERRGVLFVAVIDACHSEADPRTHFRDFNPHPVVNRFLTPPDYIQSRILSQADESKNILTSDQGDLLLSGCQRNQTSADAYIDGAYHGAFSYALGEALKNKAQPPSYQEAILAARSYLGKEGYDQVCNVDGATDAKLWQFFQVPSGAKETGGVSDPSPDRVSSPRPFPFPSAT